MKGEATAHLIEDIPTGIYTIPEISSVGKTEQQLTAMKVPYEVGRAQFKHLARAQIVGMNVGTLKFSSTAKPKNLGFTALANAPPKLYIGQAIMEQKGGGNTSNTSLTTFNYPTMAEAYRVAALNGLNRLFNALSKWPSIAPRWPLPVAHNGYAAAIPGDKPAPRYDAAPA